MSKLNLHSFHYEMDGREYAFDLPARSEAEAKRRLEAIRRTARYHGEIYKQIKLPTPLMYLAMPFLWVWFQLGARFFWRKPK